MVIGIQGGTRCRDGIGDPIAASQVRRAGIDDELSR